MTADCVIEKAEDERYGVLLWSLEGKVCQGVSRGWSGFHVNPAAGMRVTVISLMETSPQRSGQCRRHASGMLSVHCQ